MEALRVTLNIKSGFSVRSGYGIAGLLDGIIMKDKEGLPYIPGTTLKGIIKQACVELALVKRYRVYEDVVSELKSIINDGKDPNQPENLSPITRIFGTPFCPPMFEFNSAFLNPQYDDEISLLQLSSCWAESHNSICRETGTALEDHLFTYEIAAGNGLLRDVWSGEFSFEIVPKVSSIPLKITSLLICGVRFADRVGANKSRGKGVLEMKIPEKYEGKTLAEWLEITFCKEGKV